LIPNKQDISKSLGKKGNAPKQPSQSISPKKMKTSRAPEPFKKELPERLITEATR
jgi:hypothetical protein